MYPRYELCAFILASADYPCGRALKVCDFDIIMLLDEPFMKLLGAEKLHQLAVAGYCMLKACFILDLRPQELPVDAAVK